ncbi:hypothetical protein M3148_10760 [Georgenia satyanarayanai]|uniref:hypothetical protein n=1 Tax=Georgenia satyanarayanai TaxID=860221 RepID=UPI002041792C|nr:hypothetical protein [Georgenia satyanarayanai]MCM3661463.1 hypothetical protein [Georgenia satyanarayanai]
MPETLTRPVPVQVPLWTTYTTLLRWQVAQIGLLLTIGFVIVPQGVARARTDGTSLVRRE